MRTACPSRPRPLPWRARRRDERRAGCPPERSSPGKSIFSPRTSVERSLSPTSTRNLGLMVMSWNAVRFRRTVTSSAAPASTNSHLLKGITCLAIASRSKSDIAFISGKTSLRLASSILDFFEKDCKVHFQESRIGNGTAGVCARMNSVIAISHVEAVILRLAAYSATKLRVGP